MCMLCGPDKKEIEAHREQLKTEAEMLERMARHLRGLAWGSVKPHEESSERAGNVARSIVRFLVQEYV